MHHAPLTPTRLTIMIMGRTLSNLPLRITSPYLPLLAATLAVPLTTAGQLSSIVGAVGIFSPLVGGLADRYGRRLVMELSLYLVAIAALILGFTNSFPLALLLFAAFGLTKATYDPAMLAYVGDTTSYEERGRYIALTELAWSGAWLLGVPIGGLLIEQAGLPVLWWGLAGLTFLTGLSIRFSLPRTERPVATPSVKNKTVNRASIFTAASLNVFLVGFGMLFALENIFILYGAYMDAEYGLPLGQLGLISIVIAGAELAAELGSASLTDRIGKKRSVIIGLALFAISALLLPILATSLITTVIAFALAVCLFEYALVSFIPLVSEVAPAARASLIAVYFAGLGVARVLAPFVALPLFTATGSLAPTGIVSAITCVVTALIVWRGFPNLE